MLQLFTATPKKSTALPTFVRFLQGLLAIGMIAGIALLIALKKFTIADLFASALAFVATGWCVLCVSTAFLLFLSSNVAGLMLFVAQILVASLVVSLISSYRCGPGLCKLLYLNLVATFSMLCCLDFTHMPSNLLHIMAAGCHMEAPREIRWALGLSP